MNNDDPAAEAAQSRAAKSARDWPFLGKGSVLGWVLRLVFLAVVVLSITDLYQWLAGATAQIEGGAQIRLGLIVLMLLVYSVLIAVPFVPGIEIGVILLMVHGGQIAPAVYMATVAGLGLAYTAGYWLPPRLLAGFLLGLRLDRTAALVSATGTQSPKRRLARLRARLRPKIGKILIRQRYLLLAILINLPGNAIIGGGGGIALTTGLSRLCAPLPTLATFIVAVAPVPVLVWVFHSPVLPMIG